MTELEFWSRCVPRPSGCLEWQGSRNRDGYGRAPWGGSRVLAHRVAWTIAVGVIPAGMFVCHRCDNPPCCNPDHLFVGTNRDNMRDARAKGRTRNGGLRGSRHGRARLTEADIPVILGSLASGVSRAALGRRYGVQYQTISKIAAGKIWRHVARGAACAE